VNRLALGAAGVVVGTVGVTLLVWTVSTAAERLPLRARRRAVPWVYVGPAISMMTAMLVIPGALTIVNSFRDARSEEFVGFDNYRWLTTDPQIRAVLVNNAMWLILVPVTTVAWGLVIAVMADKLSRRSESLAKSAVFLPVAISLVGASTIWGFVYAVRPKGRNQIGLLNELIVRMGGDPVAWLLEPAINDIALMVIMVWLETGFAMVMLSAAIKAVPMETIEAARIDGATEPQIFWRVIAPQVKPTLIVVFTTVLISSLKVFDIVAVLTNGNFGTDVIAHRFIIELFRFRNFGHAAAIVVVLMLATIPFMALNVRSFRRQEQGL
jgi:alpha-glucoside transport system permease protein